jgi:hypothetical protein
LPRLRSNAERMDTGRGDPARVLPAEGEGRT